MLEYFHDILFLTINRVTTFNEAFQSRIHIGFRYGKLEIKAKKGIWSLYTLKPAFARHESDIRLQDRMSFGNKTCTSSGDNVNSI